MNWDGWEDELRRLRMQYLNRQLRDFELQAPDPEDLTPLTEAEVRADLQGQAPKRFLGYFSRSGLVRLGLKFGVVDVLRKKGFKPVMQLPPAEAPQHLLRIYDRETTPEHLLVEIAAHLEQSQAKRELALPQREYRFLVIDWMLLQNPRETFSAHRPRLPGQTYPGLRIGEHIGDVLFLCAERLGQDGMLTFPNHYHNGVLYARRMQFANPQRQAELEALGRDLSSLSLAERSWAVELGCVLDDAGKPYVWRGSEMIYPLTPVLVKHFKSPEYRARVDAAAARLHYRLDMEKFTRDYEPL